MVDIPPPSHARRAAAVVVLVAAVTLAGCAIQPGATQAPAAPKTAVEPVVTAESILAEALRAYDDGRYPAAQRGLRDALESGLRSRDDRVKAHKHLAFIYCASRQDTLCREAFRRALELDPSFTLTPTEAGHPLWGPVFRNLKAKASQ